ncbi:ArnT family glycosyltransferase [Verrucomicrobiota bacterium]
MNQIYEHVKRCNTALPLILFAGILAFAAYPRFINLTNEGMTGCDTFQYWILGHQWALGNYTLSDGYAGELFRPVVFALHGFAMRLFGFNDYAIKMLHASMDMINILLVFGIAALIGRSLWVGLFSALLYAFLPAVIGQSRHELIHIPSATFVLLSVLFYVLFDLIEKRGRILLGLLCVGLSGFALGCASGVHTELAFLFPPLAIMMVLSTVLVPGRRKRVILGRLLLWGGVFSLGCLSIYLAGGCYYGFEKVNELTLGVSSTLPQSQVVPFQITAGFLTRGIASLTSNVVESLFLGTVVVMVALGAAKVSTRVVWYVPWVCWLGYGILFERFIGGGEQAENFRLLIPLIPLVCVAIVSWYWNAIVTIVRRKWVANCAVGLGCIFLAWYGFIPYRSALAGHRAHYQTNFRAVHDVLKDKVDKNNKLLVASYLQPTARRGFQQRMYFGNKAIYIIDCGPNKSLEAVLAENRISYVYVGKRKLDEGILRQEMFYRHDLNDPAKCIPAPLVLGECYGMNNQTYSLEKEHAFLADVIRNKGGKTIWSNADGTICELP